MMIYWEIFLRISVLESNHNDFFTISEERSIKNTKLLDTAFIVLSGGDKNHQKVLLSRNNNG